MILGIDEVGRGSWAGPLVVGAVVLGGVEIPGLTDSKKLSRRRREELDLIIREKAKAFGLGWVETEKIDEIGLSKALSLATKLAIEQIKVPYHEIIIDGTVNFLKDTNKGQFVTTMKKADLLVPCVSAASVIAKVARDKYMADQDDLYEGYKFKSHVGYGTAKHREAIEKHGVTPLHRLSFAPLAKYCANNRSPGSTLGQNGFAPGKIRAPAPYFARVADILTLKEARTPSAKLSSKQIGDSAEDIAAKYLRREGHKILARNWKTKYCEIDIISRLDGAVFFNEVKYRKDSNQGGGLSAITKAKLRQMRFAAEYYALSKGIQGMDLRLSAISLCGNPPSVSDYLEVE